MRIRAIYAADKRSASCLSAQRKLKRDQRVHPLMGGVASKLFLLMVTQHSAEHSAFGVAVRLVRARARGLSRHHSEGFAALRRARDARR